MMPLARSTIELQTAPRGGREDGSQDPEVDEATLKLGRVDCTDKLAQKGSLTGQTSFGGKGDEPARAAGPGPHRMHAVSDFYPIWQASQCLGWLKGIADWLRVVRTPTAFFVGRYLGKAGG